MYHKWEFKLKEGGSHFAYFTDEEIEERKKLYPEVNWV